MEEDEEPVEDEDSNNTRGHIQKVEGEGELIDRDGGGRRSEGEGELTGAVREHRLHLLTQRKCIPTPPVATGVCIADSRRK